MYVYYVYADIYENVYIYIYIHMCVFAWTWKTYLKVDDAALAAHPCNLPAYPTVVVRLGPLEISD